MRIVNESNKIVIGYAGENEAVNVLFDVKGWDELYGVGTFTLLNRRPGETCGYPVEVTQEGDTVTWVVSSADTAIEGIGECELMYIVNNVIAKSVVYNTIISHALCSSDTPPEPWTPWVVTVIEAKDEAVAAKNQAIAAKDEIENMTATAEIDSNIGTPVVDVTKTVEEGHVNLDFNFQNLKGETGATGETGPQGPQGAGFISCVDDGNENVVISLEGQSNAVQKTLLYSESNIVFEAVPDEASVAQLHTAIPYDDIDDYVRANSEVIYSIRYHNNEISNNVYSHDNTLQFADMIVEESDPSKLYDLMQYYTDPITLEIYLIDKVYTPADVIAIFDANNVHRDEPYTSVTETSFRELSSAVNVSANSSVVVQIDNWHTFFGLEQSDVINQIITLSVAPSMVQSDFDNTPIIVMSQRMYTGDSYQVKLYNISDTDYSIKVIKFIAFYCRTRRNYDLN